MNIRLGLPGLEYILPPIRYAPGSGVELPTECSKNVEEAKMADGSLRINILGTHPLSFRLELDELPWAEVVKLLEIVAHNKQLNFINEYTDGLAYAVVVLGWGHVRIAEQTGQTVVLYKFTVELRGTGARAGAE